MAAVEVRVAGHDHSLPDPIRIVLIGLDHLRGEFMARDPGIIEVCKGPAVGAQITSADPAVKKLQQNFAFFSHRHFYVFDLDLAGSADIHCFHGSFLL